MRWRLALGPLGRFAWLAVAVACAAPASASTRNYLTIQGQVLDHTKSPLAGAWVFCTGSRRASAPVDSGGTYQLEIPGATLEELDRAPLKIRISARKKGWRFALANGAPEMGLEMRVAKGEGRLPRLLVRSNDGGAVSAVANSVVLDANPRALIALTFIGSQGAAYDTPPVPLDISDEVTLAGSLPSVPEIASPAPATSATSAPVEDSEPDGLADAPTTAPAPAPATKNPAPATPTPARSTPPPATSTTPGAPTSAPSTSSGSAPGVSSQSAPKTAATPPATPSATPPSAAAPQSSSGSHPKKWNAGGDGKSDNKPKVYRPAVDAGPVPVTPPPGSVSSQHAPAPSGTSTSRTTPSSPPAPAATSNATPVQDPTLKPVLSRDTPVSGVSPAPPPPATAVGVAPQSAPAQPVTSRAPAAPATGPPSAAATTCDCTIRGTVEVHADRPLTSRTEVVISVDDAPETTASVELFMGSPRAFEIHPAPCGVHRLLLWTRSRQRFVLVSSEPRVVCTPGGTQQMRLVLEPVARWGAGR